MNNKDVLDIIAPRCPFKESGYFGGGKYYSAPSLYDQAKKEEAKVYRLKIRDIDFSESVWQKDGVRLGEYAYHASRAMNSDLGIPVIVGPMGSVMDGYHRIIRAVVDRKSFVLAMRLTSLPKPSKDPEEESDD